MTTQTRTQGFYWHVHHDRLLEWCHDYDERVGYITRSKPAHEVETRLRLFRPVLHPPTALDKARDAYDKARGAYVKVRGASFKAWNAYVKAGDAAMPELIALHAIECPDCPWDGRSIFPEAIGDGP